MSGFGPGRAAVQSGQIECDTTVLASTVKSAPGGGTSHSSRMRARPHHAQTAMNPPLSVVSQMYSRNSFRSNGSLTLVRQILLPIPRSVKSEARKGDSRGGRATAVAVGLELFWEDRRVVPGGLARR